MSVIHFNMAKIWDTDEGAAKPDAIACGLSIEDVPHVSENDGDAHWNIWDIDTISSTIKMFTDKSYTICPECVEATKTQWALEQLKEYTLGEYSL